MVGIHPPWKIWSSQQIWKVKIHVPQLSFLLYIIGLTKIMKIYYVLISNSCFQRFLFKKVLSDKLMHYKCWFWNWVPKIKEAISQSKIGKFLKLRTFLKSEFCGLRKNDYNFYLRCFGSREIAKNKVSKVIVDTLYDLFMTCLRLVSQLLGTTIHHTTPYTRNNNFACLGPYYHNCGDLFITC